MNSWKIFLIKKPLKWCDTVCMKWLCCLAISSCFTITVLKLISFSLTSSAKSVSNEYCFGSNWLKLWNVLVFHFSAYLKNYNILLSVFAVLITTLNCCTKKATKQKIDYALHNLLVMELHLGGRDWDSLCYLLFIRNKERICVYLLRVYWLDQTQTIDQAPVC